MLHDGPVPPSRQGDESNGQLVEDHGRLLADRQHVRAQHDEVLPHGSAGDLHDVLGERDPAVALRILLLVHALVRVVVRQLAAERVQQLVLGAERVHAPAGQQQGATTASEECVLQQHALLVALVHILCDVLRGDHQCTGPRLVLQQLLGQVHRDHVRRAAHASEVVRAHVLPQAELVAHQRAERGCWTEQRAINNEDVDRRWPDAGALQNVSNERKDNLLCLVPGRCDSGVQDPSRVFHCQNARRPMRGLTRSGAVQDALLEL
mmetsp:Transcript_149971/g.481929  ORF Transcript_149971/g.481929 Transcript_149971/m.481929 type:complete len:264 (-) Transcript_149971:904-1695(-)